MPPDTRAALIGGAAGALAGVLIVALAGISLGKLADQPCAGCAERARLAADLPVEES